MRSQVPGKMAGVLLTALCIGAPQVQAVVNNGFETDYYWSAYKNYSVARFQRAVQGEVLPTPWKSANTAWSLTFAGTSANDARLFLLYPTAGWSDARVFELNASGGEVRSANMSAITTQTWGGCEWLGMRYNPVRNSLVIATDDDSISTDYLKVYEINLDLSLKATHTYTVAPAPNAVHATVAVNSRNGHIYVMGHGLNSAAAAKGDVLELDPVSDTWSVLIDGDTQDSTWNWPTSLAFRESASGNASDDTLLVVFENDEPTFRPVREHYVSNGSLKTTHDVGAAGIVMWMAQQHRKSKEVFFCSDRGHYKLTSANDISHFWDEEGERYFDVASPGVETGCDSVFLPAVIAAVPAYDDDAMGGVQYTKQMTLSQGTSVTWSLLAGPTGAVINSTTGLVSGWVPSTTAYETAVFTVHASNVSGAGSTPECPGGTSDVSWTVRTNLKNNGFHRNWIYSCKKPSAGGSMKAFDENANPVVLTFDDFQPDNSNWSSLTFAGNGGAWGTYASATDARMFVIRSDPQSGTVTDITIQELDANGQAVTGQTVLLGAIVPPGYGITANHLGDEILPGQIRYNRLRDQLYVSFARKKDGVWTAWTVAVDKELTSVSNAWQGPTLPGGDFVGIDLGDDGTLYMTSPNLNGTTGKGDLIAFDTSGGSSTTYETLIDGDTLGDASWVAPVGVVYRGKHNPANKRTILVLMTGQDSGSTPNVEFLLDSTNGATGNLIKRGVPIMAFMGNAGQMDSVSETIWLAQHDAGGSVRGLRRDDTEWFPTDHDSSGHAWWDTASPPGPSAMPASPCNQTVFADMDWDNDVDMADFAILQRCDKITAGPISTDPPHCECLDRNEDTFINADDVAEFVKCATGPGIPFNAVSPPAGCVP